MNYFQAARLARMSDGTYCIIRDLGLVKGGKGLKHHESLLTLTAKGLASKLVQLLRHAARRLQHRRDGGTADSRLTPRRHRRA
jgi:hypothetical protein